MPGWFKEQNLWPATGLNAQCKGFKCKLNRTDCCCWQLFFFQLDYTSQKSHLEENITSCSHICNFYPNQHTCDMDVMERNVLSCLDDVPLLRIQRYANQSTHFISVYVQGLTGGKAAWANHQYHRHHTLPPSMILEVKEALRKA
ncbi:hypothetical protein BDR05DRAFT_978851 [Suillus weaverae]|nr:hypothetical protein BDR05DRAFT_978851 [Suillus weaverae]